MSVLASDRLGMGPINGRAYTTGDTIRLIMPGTGDRDGNHQWTRRRKYTVKEDLRLRIAHMLREQAEADPRVWWAGRKLVVLVGQEDRGEYYVRAWEELETE